MILFVLIKYYVFLLLKIELIFQMINNYIGTFYLEFWKREEAGIQFLWDVSTFTGEEVMSSTS